MERRDTARWAGPERRVGGESVQQPRRGSASIAEAPLLPQTLASRPPRSPLRLRPHAETPARLGPVPPPPPLPSLASHSASASLSLPVEEVNHQPPQGAPRPQKQHQTWSRAPAPEGPAARGAGSGRRPHGRSREGSPAAPPLPPRPAPPRPEPGGPQPRGPPAPSFPPLSREAAEHTSIDGVAHPGKVSLQLARAWRGLAFLGPGPGRGVGVDPGPPRARERRPVWRRARPRIQGDARSAARVRGPRCPVDPAPAARGAAGRRGAVPARRWPRRSRGRTCLRVSVPTLARMRSFCLFARPSVLRLQVSEDSTAEPNSAGGGIGLILALGSGRRACSGPRSRGEPSRVDAARGGEGLRAAGSLWNRLLGKLLRGAQGCVAELPPSPASAPRAG